MKRVLIAGASCAALFLVGCTSSQLATANKYQSDVQAACAIAEAATTAASAASSAPEVGQAANLVAASCGSESAIASLISSPTSVAWLNTLITTLKSGGKVVPPAPVTL